MQGIVSIMGIPGSGKTTQVKLLEEALGKESVFPVSVPRLFRGEQHLLSLFSESELIQLQTLAETSRTQSQIGNLAPIALDRLLFSALPRAMENTQLFLLDACPRGPQQVLILRDSIGESAWKRLSIFHLCFPFQAEEEAFRRQFDRTVANRGNAEAIKRIPRMKRKIEVFYEHTLSAINILRESGRPVEEIDAIQPVKKIHSYILERIYECYSL